MENSKDLEAKINHLEQMTDEEIVAQNQRKSTMMSHWIF